MSRRATGFTGANAIPLGTRNKAIGAKRQFTSSPPRDKDHYDRRDHKPPAISEKASAALKAAQAAAAVTLAKINKNPGAIAKRSAPPVDQSMINVALSTDRGRPRRKKSRWATETLKTVVPGMPTTMPTNLTPQQEKAYIVQLQIEDVTRKLKCGDLGIAPNPEDRSPSPEPIYNGEGKRMNTREYRTRKRLEEERHRLVQEMTEINPDYKPPADYKPLLQRVSERVSIPADINPNINFVGLLIGPRGNTLKKIEKESNCKIMIRGKGSVKEGKVVRKDNHPLPGEDEPLHALVSSNCVENVNKAVNEILQIIKQGIEQPEEENDLRKLQLMELAKLNGTLREDLMPRERAWLKPENQNITNTTICSKCGGRGHLAQDCRAAVSSGGPQDLMQSTDTSGGIDRAKMDSEYMSLMAEIGESPAPSQSSDKTTTGNGATATAATSNRPPRPLMGNGNNFNQTSGPRGPPGYGPRSWMAPHGPPGYGMPGPRGYGPPGGFANGSSMMNPSAPPMPWMPHSGPYGPPNQWGPPGAMGYPNMHEMTGDGSNMTQQWSQDTSQYNAMTSTSSSMYTSGPDQSGGYGQPPPPPGSAPQPPPPPGSGDMSQWQQQWVQSSDNSGAAGDASMGYGMWNMNPPPMPSGPGPVPPPPPTSQDSSNSSGMEYGQMIGGGYAMPPAPPPPPPQ